MGRSRYKFYDEHYPYFITSTLLEELPLFSKPQIAQVLLDQFVYLQQQRTVTLYAFVIMENHFHAVVQGQELFGFRRVDTGHGFWWDDFMS